MKFNWNLYAPTKESSPVRVVVNHRGKTYYKAIGITVQTRQWKMPKKGPQYCTDTKVAGCMRKIDLYLQTNLDDRSTDADIKRVLSGIAAGRAELPVESTQPTKTFWSYYDEFSSRERAGKRQHRSTFKIIGELMGKEDNWDNLNADWFRRLIDEFNKRGFSDNYKSVIISRLKTCLKEAYDNGIHTNDSFTKVRKVFTPSDTIYLTEDEIESLWRLELDNKREGKARDLFLLGFYCAARFSDYSTLNESMIRDDTIHLISRKTGVESLIPCSSRVKVLLERNGGSAPKMSQQELNREIKKVCQKAGITQLVTKTIVKGGRQVKTVLPKCEMVSSHTPRRSAATLLTMQGAPERSVMMITGHKTHSAFASYIRLTKEENVSFLRNHTFFK